MFSCSDCDYHIESSIFKGNGARYTAPREMRTWNRIVEAFGEGESKCFVLKVLSSWQARHLGGRDHSLTSSISFPTTMTLTLAHGAQT